MELKILVADRISAFHRYVEAHANLFTSETPGDLSLQTKTVIDNYLENHLIYDELNHYKQHHEILGNHPVFAWFKRLQEIRTLKPGELFKLQSLLLNYVNRLKSKINKDPHNTETGKRLERIANWEKELNEIKLLV